MTNLAPPRKQPTESLTVTSAAIKPQRSPLDFGWWASRFSVIGVWILMIVVFGIITPERFLSAGVPRVILSGQLEIVFLAAALLCTIIVGEFVDMSVPANYGIAGTVVAVLTVNLGTNVWLSALLAIAVSTLVGLVNGLLVVRLGVNTIVVTLGMSTVLAGLAIWASGAQPISGVPREFTAVVNTNILGLPVGFYLGLILMLGFAYVLQFTPLGRNMRFVGANREVSRLAGVRVDRVRLGAFVAAGAIAGLGGVLSAAKIGGFDAATAQTYLLPMFATVFLGTAILFPGKFNPIGALLAAYFLATGTLGLQLALIGTNSNLWVPNVFYGAVLVIAVTASTVLGRRSR
ncbi:ABC transporter permease [Microbacterium sp. NPDC096154]|uniref:ABC transporter permease n=1 Tax=Microbacterium sp. NPDC096154 TaxID=3155549 RepID=UPI003326EF4A